MNNKLCKFLISFLIILPAYSEPKITNEMVNDYLDIANLYQNRHEYNKALDYIEMIEPYDKFNPKIIYQKIYLLKSLNDIELAEKELDKLISLNQDYVCSDLALSIYKQLKKQNICCRKSY